MKFYVILYLLLSSSFVSLCCFVSQNSTAQNTADNLNSSLPKTQSSPEAASLLAQKLLDTSNWRTYREAGGGYEFKYPSNLRVEQNGEIVRLFHQIKFKHQSPCQPQINAGGEEDEYEGKKLDYLIDFDMSFRMVDGGIKDAYLAGEYDEDYAVKTIKDLDKFYKQSNFLLENSKLNPVSIKDIKQGGGTGGCGSYVYAIPLAAQKSLLVKRVYITLLNVSATYYLDVPVAEAYTKRLKKRKDLIVPEQEEQLFYTIIATWQKLK